MSAILSKYRKLPGATRGFLGQDHLWLGDDHLLSVTSRWGPERYRRYYFRDIEALVVQRTNERLGWNLVYAIVTTLFAIWPVVWLIQNATQSFIGSADEVAGAVLAGICGSISLVFLVALLVNSVRGPMCRLQIQLAAGNEKVGAPRRLKKARKLIGILEPEILRSQAGVSVPAAPSMAAGTPEPSLNE